MKTTLRHELPCTPDQFWEAFFDPVLNERMHKEALGCTEVVCEAQDGDVAGGLTRTLRSTQPIDAPGPIRKLMGDETTTVETGTFADGTWSFEMRPTTLGDKIQLRGTTTVEAAAEGCVRNFTLEGKVKILGVGKVMEGFIDKQTKDAQNATAEWFRTNVG